MRGISKLIAWAFALAPVVLLLTTWGEHLSPLQKQFRMLGLPVAALELAVIVMSAMQGMKLPRPPLWVIAAVLALLAVAWGTAVTADHAPASIIRTTLWTLHLSFGLAIVNLVAAGAIDPEDFPPAIVTGFAVFSALFCVFVVSVYRPGYDWIEDVPAYSHIRWFGYYAAAVVGLCATGFVEARKRYWAVTALAVGLALWTGSRGTPYAVVAGYGVAFVLFPGMREGWQRVAGALLCSLVLASILTFIAPIGEGVGRLVDTSNSGRTEAWLGTIRLISERPLFGWGEEQLRFHRLIPMTITHPHNVILQVLMAWGVVGFALVAALGLWLARKAIAATNAATFPLTLAVLNIAAFAFIDGALFHVQSAATFALCLALLTTRRTQQ